MKRGGKGQNLIPKHGFKKKLRRLGIEGKLFKLYRGSTEKEKPIDKIILIT